LCLVTWCHIHNILSTAPQLSISQKALRTLREDGNVMPKHVGATIHDLHIKHKAAVHPGQYADHT
jgi:hypothetical protein